MEKQTYLWYGSDHVWFQHITSTFVVCCTLPWLSIQTMMTWILVTPIISLTHLMACVLQHQQNQVNLDSLDRAVQRSIEPQKLQKGALLYSSARYPTKSVQHCVGLPLSVSLCTEWPEMEKCFFLFFGSPLHCYCSQLHCEKRVKEMY